MHTAKLLQKWKKTDITARHAAEYININYYNWQYQNNKKSSQNDASKKDTKHKHRRRRIQPKLGHGFSPWRGILSNLQTTPSRRIRCINTIIVRYNQIRTDLRFSPRSSEPETRRAPQILLPLLPPPTSRELTPVCRPALPRPNHMSVCQAKGQGWYGHASSQTPLQKLKPWSCSCSWREIYHATRPC